MSRRSKTALAAAFGDSRLRTPYVRVTRTFKPIASAAEKFATPDKENTMYVARTAFALRDADPDYPALRCSRDYIVGTSDASRLWMRVREKEGLSYNVFSELRCPRLASDHVSWTFGFIANPQNAAKAEAALKDELATVLREGFSDEEFERRRRSMLDQRVIHAARGTTRLPGDWWR